MGKVLITGDVMLDTYVFGNVGRISPEAPVPVLLEDDNRKTYVPGGAANVAVNVRAAGHEAALFSVVGDDENGKRLIQRIKDEQIEVDLVGVVNDRATTSKLRYIGQSNQQILRVDREVNKNLEYEELEDAFVELINRIDSYDLIVLSDYKKGFLSPNICKKLIEIGNKHNIPVLIDVKDKNIEKYKGAYLLKPNRNELEELSGVQISTFQDAVDAAIKLSNMADSKYVLATLGADGMILTDKEKLIKRVQTVAKEVYDVTGAGDTAAAYLAASLAEGMSIEDAVERANVAAGVQVSKMGTSLVYPDEVERTMNSAEGAWGKSLNLYSPTGMDHLERNRNGKKVVFTNGCFDILHAGHVTYLQKARELGDLLVVGINSDSSVKRLKGDSRPINGIEDRVKILSALACVDYVVVFEEDTPLDLIMKIKPDILVKGGDYRIDEIVGADFVGSYGGVTTTIPFVQGRSTTGLLKKMRSEQ